MDLSFLMDYVVYMIVGICLCVGFIIKNIIDGDEINKFIPLIMGILGVILNVWMTASFTPTVLLGGLISGLASTGMYELFKNLINKKN